jgi:hypothetical protein
MTTPRSDHGLAQTDGKIYAVGGFDEDPKVLASVERYDPSADSWSRVSSMSNNRSRTTAAASGGYIFALGGYRDNNDPTSIVEKYDASADSWTTVSSMPTARYSTASAAVNGNIYVIGGNDGLGAVSTVEKYDVSADSWTTVSSMPTARDELAATAIDGEIYAIGGDDGNGAVATVEKYDPSTDSWTTVSSLNTARYRTAAASLNGKVYVMGGDDGTNLRSVEIYDPSADSWTFGKDLVTERRSHGAAFTQEEAFVSGGYSSSRLASTSKTISKVTDPSVTIGGSTVSFSGDLTGSETHTESISIGDTGTKTVDISTTDGDLKADINRIEVSQSVDPVVELNGDSNQQITIDGSLADGETVVEEIDNSWLTSGDNTATVSLNETGLGADDPPMEARVSIEKPAQSARYVSAPYSNLTRSNGIGIDWSGSGTLDVTVQGWTGSSWEDARQLSTSQTGDVVLDYAPIDYQQTRVEIAANNNVEIQEESIQFFTSTPEIHEASATPVSDNVVSESPVELSINVSDADFGTSQGDSVNVTFYDADDDSQIGSQTLTSKSTATASWGDVVGGSNEWYAVATDSYGNSMQSQTFTFNAPNELEIRALDTQELITQDANGDALNVEVQFFGGEGAVATRNTTDGMISMTGLPVDQRFAVNVDAGDGYVSRQILITSLIDQQTAYLLNNSASVETVSPRFVLEDPSNQFDTEESEIILERPIEVNGTTEFVPVAGDRIGLNGFDTTLEKGQRYRVTVRDPNSGAERRLGEFTPTVSEQVTLTVQDVEFDSVSDVDGIDWTARYLANEDSADQIEFLYRDADTSAINYQIYERGNDSNLLTSGSATGNVTATETVPAGEENTVWVVEWDATLDNGETISGTRQVSSGQLPVGPGLAPEWQTGLSMVGLFVVAGLFGAANPAIGGIAVATTGGFFWMLGWLPDGTSGLMVLLALFISVLSFGARKARGTTA